MTKKHEIRSLTGLRGVAALYVMTYHANQHGVGIGPLNKLIAHGYLGVDLFFVLSGFVMALTYSGYVQAGALWSRYTEFLARRLGRIYPLYGVVTLICLVLATLSLHEVHGISSLWQATVKNLIMIQAWGFGGTGLNDPGWSISAEWGAYLLFPLLARLALLSSSKTAIIAGVVSFGLIVGLAALPREFVGLVDRGPLNFGSGPTPAPLVRCVVEFTLGLIAWRASRNIQRAFPAFSNRSAFVIAAIITLLLMISNTEPFIVLLFACLIISLSTDAPLLARILGTPLLHRLGELSYAIYLCHSVVLESAPWLEDRLASWGVGPHHAIGHLLAVAAIFPVASILHSVVELPSRALAVSYINRNLRPRQYVSTAG